MIGKRYGLDPAAMVDVLDQVDRRVVDSLHPHPPARPKPQLRRSVQARANAEGHRHRDPSWRSQSVDAPRRSTTPAQELWRAAAGDAAPEASVSELGAGSSARPHRDHSRRCPPAGAALAMRILVTGAAGFLGRALVHVLRVGHDVVATDRDDGDIADREHVAHLFARPVDRVFHLAAIVSGAAEADFAAGQRVNLEATLRLLEQCRAQAARGGPVVRWVYASSIAVFGTPLPERIDDRTAPAPSLSYGTDKRVCELLVDDASRRGELDGPAPRLPGVVVRPAQPNGALSAFNSDLIREPLAGHLYECPVGPEATIWVTSRRAAVANLLRLGDVDAGALGAQRTVTARASRSRSPRSSPRSAVSMLPPQRAFATGAGPRSRRGSAAGRATPRSGRRFARPGRRGVDRRLDPRSSGNDTMTPPAKKLVSAVIKEGLDRAPHRAFLRADRHGRRGHGQADRRHRQPARRRTYCAPVDCRLQADAARLGVAAAAQGVAVPFTTISVSDGVSMEPPRHAHEPGLARADRRFDRSGDDGARLRRAGRLRRLRQDAARRDGRRWRA